MEGIEPMMQLQFRFTQQPDGLVQIEMDRFEREDATEDERKLVNQYHDMCATLMLAQAESGRFEYIGEDANAQTEA